MELQKRKPTRSNTIDYSKSGAYFLTICTKDRKHILSSIVGDGVLDVPKTSLSDYGKIVEKQIVEMNNIYDDIHVDKYVIMPNHIHLIVFISCHDGGTSRTPSPTVSKIPLFISSLKRYTNKKAGFNLWQRSYYDHVVRNQKDYIEICKYIEINPKAWQYDRLFFKE